MDREDKFWLSLGLAIILGICLFTFTICNFIKENNRVAFENGYERQTLIGSRCTHWTKIDKY